MRRKGCRQVYAVRRIAGARRSAPTLENENVITESFVLLAQELVSSIAFKIATRLKIGQNGRWKLRALEFFVFAFLVISLFFIFGFWGLLML